MTNHEVFRSPELEMLKTFLLGGNIVQLAAAPSTDSIEYLISVFTPNGDELIHNHEEIEALIRGVIKLAAK